ncbi:MAG: hypothetical protein ACYC0M_15385 [Burkholderiales bacterium]
MTLTDKECQDFMIAGHMLSDYDLVRLIYKAGAEAEREACAQECVRQIMVGGDAYDCYDSVQDVAAALRARGGKL